MNKSIAVMSISALLALGGVAQAEDYAGPRELVQAIYQPLLDNKDQGDVSRFYTQRLKGLFAQHGENLAHGAGITDETVAAEVRFNPFIDSEHHLLYDFAIGEPMTAGDTALVNVKFFNFDHPTLLAITARKEGDGWKVDDVTSMGGDEPWMLSWLLQYNLYSN